MGREVTTEAVKTVPQPLEIFNVDGHNMVKINGKDALVLNEYLTIKYKLSGNRGIIYSLYKDGRYANIYTYHSDNKSIQDVINKLTVTSSSEDRPFKFNKQQQ